MYRSHYTNQLKAGTKAKVAGYVYDFRDKGKILFVTLRDREGIVQITVKEDSVPAKIFESFKKLHKEMLIAVEGKVVESKIAKSGIEIFPSSVAVVADSEYPLPLEVTGRIESNLDTRLDWRFLDMRDMSVMKTFRMQSVITGLLEEFCRKEGFERIFISRLVGESTEGGTEYFKVKYFDRDAFLAQSPQLYKEAVLASGIDKVYDLGFVYRAEPHHTTRHLCEYMSFDVETIAEELEEILDFEERLMQFVFGELNTKHKKFLEEMELTLESPKKIPRLKLTEANKILKEMNVETEEHDLTPAGEKALSEYCRKKFGTSFVFVTHFPFAKKPFYIKRGSVGQETLSFDLIYDGLEITSGGIREHRYKERSENLKAKGLNPKDFAHLEFWKYGMPPHGGFAIGIERLTEKILKLENVREATLLPRDPTRLNP